MFESFSEAHSIVRVFDQKSRYKVLDLRREIFRKLNINIDNFSICFLSAFARLERRMPSTQLITEDSDTPDIDHLIIFRAKHNLRRNIVKSATECLSFVTKLIKIILFTQVNGPSKVGKLDSVVD